MVQRCFREGNSKTCKNQLLVTSIGPTTEWKSFAILTVFRFELGMMHNPALQPTANALRGLSVAELGRLGRQGENSMSATPDKYRGTITYARVLGELRARFRVQGCHDVPRHRHYYEIATAWRLHGSPDWARPRGNIRGRVSGQQAHAQRGGGQRARQTRARFLHARTRAWSAMPRGRGTGFLGR